MSIWSVVGKNLSVVVRREAPGVVAAKSESGLTKGVGKLVDEYLAKHPVRSTGMSINKEAILAERYLHETEAHVKLVVRDYAMFEAYNKGFYGF